MMKKYFVALMVSVLAFPVVASAHPPIAVYVDGSRIVFDQEPIIIDDRTLVPMRAIFQALGCEVIWSEPAQTITSIRKDDVIVLKIGDSGLYKNGILIYTMPVPAQIVNERTLVPVRAIAEALDAQVAWDGTDYVVTILSEKVGVQEGGYSASVQAQDGTVVLTVQIDYDRTHADLPKVESALSAEAFRLGESFVRDYRDAALAAHEKAKAQGEHFSSYYCVGTYALMREDGKYVSFLGTTTQYMGENTRGATSHTYAVPSQKELALTEIISDDPAELEYFWYKSFLAIIQAKPENFYENAGERLLNYTDHVGYYLTTDGIAFYLPPKLIGPNEAGIISFSVQYPL